MSTASRAAIVAGNSGGGADRQPRTLPAGPQREPQSSRRKCHPRRGRPRVCASYIEMIEECTPRISPAHLHQAHQLGLEPQQELCASLAASIARRARDLGRTIEMDMESSAYTDATLDIFENCATRVRQYRVGDPGLSASHGKDLQRLAPLKPKIRLVKGAYREPKKIALQGNPQSTQLQARDHSVAGGRAAQGIFLPAIASHDRSWSRTRKRKSRA